MWISLGLTTVLFGEGLLNVSTSTSSSLSLKYVSQVKLMSERFNNNRVLKETVEGTNLTTTGQAIISIIPSQSNYNLTLKQCCKVQTRQENRKAMQVAVLWALEWARRRHLKIERWYSDNVWGTKSLWRLKNEKMTIQDNFANTLGIICLAP